ncbi:MAG: hypothetical protein SNJ64_02560 [Endomicrobiia bacterium]
MIRLFIFIAICIASFLVVKFFIKITSFVIKSIIWLTIIAVGIYVVNYFVLPKFNYKPYNLETKFVIPAKSYTKKIISEIEKKSVPDIKKVKKTVVEKINKKTK